MAKPVVHFEFWSQDPGKCADFYKQVFEWEINEIPEMQYHLVKAGPGGIGGGIMKPKDGPWPSNLAFYIQVEDLAPYRKKILDAGGQIIVEQMDVPNVGSFSLFADPDGRVLGIWLQK